MECLKGNKVLKLSDPTLNAPTSPQSCKIIDPHYISHKFPLYSLVTKQKIASRTMAHTLEAGQKNFKIHTTALCQVSGVTCILHISLHHILRASLDSRRIYLQTSYTAAELPPRVIPNKEDVSFMVCINQLPQIGRTFKLAMQAEHVFRACFNSQ